jgi:hypothetical protein
MRQLHVHNRLPGQTTLALSHRAPPGCFSWQGQWQALAAIRLCWHAGTACEGHPAQVVPVKRSRDDAVQAFHAYHRRLALSPFNLLADPSSTVELVYYPFWAFGVTASGTYTAQVGHAAGRSAVIEWTARSGSIEQRSVHPSEADVLVPATYSLRPSLLGGLKPSLRDALSHAGSPRRNNQSHTLPLSAEVLQSLGRAAAHVQPVAMHQEIAWELAARNLRHTFEDAAAQQCRALYNTDHVRDVQLTLSTQKLSVKIAYFPAYLISYTYGSHQVEGSIEIVQQRHQALVAAVRAHAGADVIADRHFSPATAQTAAAAAVASAKAAAVAALALPASAVDALSAVATVDTAFVAFLAASAARLAAQGFTGFVRERRTASAQRRAGELSEQYMAGGRSAADIEGPHDLWLRADAEWLRWEGQDTEAWEPARRLAWAERLLAEHRARACGPTPLLVMLTVWHSPRHTTSLPCRAPKALDVQRSTSKQKHTHGT